MAFSAATRVLMFEPDGMVSHLAGLWTRETRAGAVAGDGAVSGLL